MKKKERVNFDLIIYHQLLEKISGCLKVYKACLMVKSGQLDQIGRETAEKSRYGCSADDARADIQPVRLSFTSYGWNVGSIAKRRRG